MNSLVRPLLAHLGGIDEVGIFLVPALATIAVLRWAERRARSRSDAENNQDGPDVDGPSPDH